MICAMASLLLESRAIFGSQNFRKLKNYTVYHQKIKIRIASPLGSKASNSKYTS
jgi:hypothetical protein